MIFPHRNIFIGIFSLIGIVSGLIITSQVKLGRPTAGLIVEASPGAQVYIDNKQIGVTPLDQKLPPGEVLLKLVPNAASLSGQVFQTKIRLTDKVYTLVRREFFESESAAAGDTTTLIPISGQLSPLSIVSDPDSASVFVDSQPQGFTPLNLESLSPGKHQIDVTAPGFTPRSISLMAAPGYKLQMIVKLSDSGKPVSLPDPGNVVPTPTSVSGEAKIASASAQFARILTTPTGFLRVRSGPSVGAPEVARVDPGTRLLLIERQTGWYRVSLADIESATSSGWISSEYSSLEP